MCVCVWWHGSTRKGPPLHHRKKEATKKGEIHHQNSSPTHHHHHQDSHLHTPPLWQNLWIKDRLLQPPENPQMTRPTFYRTHHTRFQVIANVCMCVCVCAINVPSGKLSLRKLRHEGYGGAFTNGTGWQSATHREGATLSDSWTERQTEAEHEELFRKTEYHPPKMMQRFALLSGSCIILWDLLNLLILFTGQTGCTSYTINLQLGYFMEVKAIKWFCLQPIFHQFIYCFQLVSTHFNFKPETSFKNLECF